MHFFPIENFIKYFIYGYQFLSKTDDMDKLLEHFTNLNEGEYAQLSRASIVAGQRKDKNIKIGYMFEKCKYYKVCSLGFILQIISEVKCFQDIIAERTKWNSLLKSFCSVLDL